MEKIIVCVCVNSTFGRCCHCPCGKEEEEEKKEDGKKTKEEEKIAGIAFQLHETHSNLGNELISNTYNWKPPETIKNEKTTKNDNEPLGNQNDDEKILINNGNNEEPLVNKYTIELLENQNDDTKNLINQIINVICDGCINTKDSESKTKLVFYDPDVGASKKPSLKIVELEFGFCEKHKKCVHNKCENDAEYLFQCRHRMCKAHYEWVMSTKPKPGYFCKECKTWMCGCFYREGMNKHLWCNYAQKGHYYCFDGLDGYNPYYRYKTYDAETWLCQNHNLDF